MPPPLLDNILQGGNLRVPPSTPPLKTKMTMSEFLSGLASGGVSGLLKLATGSIGSLLDTAINGSWRTQARFQRDMQKQLMSHQAELNREQYDYEMSQESPVAQRQRLEAAGFNPALMMSGSGGSSGISASVGSVSGGSAGMPHTPGLGLPNISLTELSQIEANEAIARDKNADADDKEYNLNRRKKMDEAGALEYEMDAMELDNDIKRNSRDLLNEQILSQREERRISKIQADIMELTKDYTVRVSKATADKLESELVGLGYQNKILSAQSEKAKEQVANMLAIQVAEVASLRASAYADRMAGSLDWRREKHEKELVGLAANQLKIDDLITLATLNSDSNHNGVQDLIETIQSEMELALRDANWSSSDVGHAVKWIMNVLGQVFGGVVKTLVAKKFGN